MLRDNEYDIIMKSNVGLYQDDYKLLDYQNGRLYLTNQRIIFINESLSNKHLYLNLNNIERTDVYNGFLKSSPKIILHLKHGDGTDDDLLADVISFTWVCPICSYSNDLSNSRKKLEKMKDAPGELPICDTCGVRTTYDVIEKYILRNDEVLLKNQEDLISFDGRKCPHCTFINHPSMSKCEICGSNLPMLKNSIDSPHPVHREDKKVPLKLEPFDKISPTVIKASFRNGGFKEFNNSLTQCLEKLRISENQQQKQDSEHFNTILSLKGIHGLANKSQEQNQQASDLLGKSIQDIDQLMSKANELIVLSKKYQSVLKNKKTSVLEVDRNFELLSNSKNSVLKLNSLLNTNEIGKSINNVKVINALNTLKKGKHSTNSLSKLPSAYIDELARHICDFMLNENILDKNNGFITMYELYLAYNKFRQIDLVTPEEIFDSINRFDELSINLKVETISLMGENNLQSEKKAKLGNCVYVISKKNQANTITTKIATYIRNNSGKSILDIQLHFNINFLIMKYILDKLVDNGELAVDKTLEGYTYWPNEILEFRSMENKVGVENVNIRKAKPLTSMDQISDAFKTFPALNSDIKSDRFHELGDLNFE